MALPQFTISGNIAEILGTSTASVLDLTYPSTLRVSFTTNFDSRHDLIAHDGKLYKFDTPIYAAVQTDGSLLHATMVDGVLTADSDPIILVGTDGINVSDFQYQFSLQKPTAGTDPWGYTYWEELSSFWFDAALNGATLDLADVAPFTDTTRKRGPAAGIVSGYLDSNGDLILTNVDGSYTTPIVFASGTIVFVDNGDGTVQVG